MTAPSLRGDLSFDNHELGQTWGQPACAHFLSSLRILRVSLHHGSGRVLTKASTQPALGRLLAWNGEREKNASGNVQESVDACDLAVSQEHFTPAGAGQRSDRHRLRTSNGAVLEVVLEALPLTISVFDAIKTNSQCVT